MQQTEIYITPPTAGRLGLTPGRLPRAFGRKVGWAIIAAVADVARPRELAALAWRGAL